MDGNVFQRRGHFEKACDYVAKNRSTAYKDVAFDRLIPLAFYLTVPQLAAYSLTKDKHTIVNSIFEIYNSDGSNLYHDWMRYCKNLKNENDQAQATLEGALFFAAESLPPSEKRESWMSSCLDGFHALKHGNDAVSGQELDYHGSEGGPSNVVKSQPVVRSEALSQSLDHPSAPSPASQTPITPIPVQQEADGSSFHDYNVPIAEHQELDDVAPPQVMAIEHQQQGTIVPCKRQHTAEVLTSKGDSYEDVGQEKIKLIKRSNEIDYKGSSTPIDNLPLLIQRLPTAMGSSKQWKWERKFFGNNVKVSGDVGEDRTDCLNFFVPKNPSQDISVTLMVGHEDGLALIHEMGVRIIRV